MTTDGAGGRSPDRATIERLHPDISVTLASVERRRAHLWSVAAVFMLVASAVVAIALSGADLEQALLPEAPALRYALLGIAAAFLIYVVDQERRLRHLTRRLFEAEVLAASLQSRIRDLTTLTRVGQLVNSVLTMEEVLEVLLDAVFELTGAVRGSVLFLEEDQLRVAVSAGENAPPRDAAVPTGQGVVGWVVANREPLLITGKLSEDQFPGHHRSRRRAGSSVTVPMLAGDELVGVLAVERAADTPPFDEIQLRSVALFGAQAATAVSNARRYEEQRSQVEQLADALERRSEFVATLVHELKTPLTAIVGFAHVLSSKAERLDADARSRMVHSVREQADRLREMVDEVLRVASADAGAELRREPVDVGEVIASGIENARAVALARDGEPRTFTVHGDQPGRLFGDPDALERVLANLLENAVKYSPAGSPVEVETATGDGEVTVSVIDHGPGIDPDELDHVFERFRRASGSGGGVGLGLYIVRSLVTAHGGRVWAESPPGGGAIFRVALPVRRADAEGGQLVGTSEGDARSSATEVR